MAIDYNDLTPILPTELINLRRLITLAHQEQNQFFSKLARRPAITQIMSHNSNFRSVIQDIVNIIIDYPYIKNPNYPGFIFKYKSPQENYISPVVGPIPGITFVVDPLPLDQQQMFDPTHVGCEAGIELSKMYKDIDEGFIRFYKYDKNASLSGSSSVDTIESIKRNLKESYGW